MTKKKLCSSKLTIARREDIEHVKRQLSEMCFEFVGRQPVRQARGFVYNPMGHIHLQVQLQEEVDSLRLLKVGSLSLEADQVSWEA
jgi:hypothetical protein